MGKVDLHIHSTASDGRFSSEEIVQRAVALGLTVIAIADHDCVDGVVPALRAARDFPELRVIPNVEISTDTPGGEVHVLGYFIDHTSNELQANLERFRDSRQRRAQGMIAKLRGLGVEIEWSRVKELAGGGSVGRPHLALAMLEKGYITSLKEAFIKYIAKDGPAYVERDKMTPGEAVELVLRADGLPVLAHPFTVTDPEMMVSELKRVGLVAIEAYYNGYSEEQVGSLVSLAGKYDLIASGGSDYHGLDDNNETMMGDIDMPTEIVEQIIALARQRGLKSVSTLRF